MRLYSIQLLRFFAALFVLFFHLQLMDSGYKGVDIFFVISGFVMYYTTFQIKRKSVKAFYTNRLTKIFLLYWLVLILLYFVKPYKIDSSFPGTFFLLPDHHMVLMVSWTLSYELYFYVVFGIVVYAVKQNRAQASIFWVLLIACTVSALLNAAGLLPKRTPLNFLLGQNFWQFLLGILSAYLSAGILQKLNKTGMLLCIAASVLALLLIEIPYTYSINHIVYGALAFCIIAFLSAYENKYPVNSYWSKIFAIAGDASYAIYLIQPVVLLLIPSRDVFSKIEIIVVTIAAAILLNQLIENRLLRFVRKRLI